MKDHSHHNHRPDSGPTEDEQEAKEAEFRLILRAVVAVTGKMGCFDFADNIDLAVHLQSAVNEVIRVREERAHGAGS